jgi:wyosine [tRNA(Phe)-imidazoG37] synthetase (radical SAM superfamily)
VSTFLFNEIIFGPVTSRRLGISLGINLLPVSSKICTFDCIYCECGWTNTDNLQNNSIPSADKVRILLEEKIIAMKSDDLIIDSFTFAGNGEPTLHPEFAEIVDITVGLRDKYYPGAVITVLSNASVLHREKIIDALKKVDKSMLKLDVGKEETFQLINKPRTDITLLEIVDNLKKFNGKLIIQSLFIKGEHNGVKIDNTAEDEINEWVKHIITINPELVVIYSISREPADKNIIKVSKDVLDSIADKLRNAGLNSEVYY